MTAIPSTIERRSHPRVVVVIPTLNEANHIGKVLEELSAQRALVPDMQIVVSDGGSSDGTVDIVKDFAVQHAFVEVRNNPKKIQSAGINSVARDWSGRADVLIRCDAHASYPSNFISSLLDTIDRTRANSVVVTMETIGSTCVQRAIAWVSNASVGSGAAAHRTKGTSGFIDHGHHAAFNLRHFLTLGGYDESFTHNEDAEFDCRLTQAGGRIYLNADIRIGYFPRRTLSGLFRQYFSYGKGRSKTLQRHPASLRLRQAAVPLHLIVSLLSIAAAVVAQSWLFLAWPAAYLALLAVFSVLTAFEKKSVCGLLTGAAAAVMHAAWATGFLTGLLFHREPRWRHGKISLGDDRLVTKGADRE